MDGVAHLSIYSFPVTWLVPRHILETYSLSDFLVFGKFSWGSHWQTPRGKCESRIGSPILPNFISPPFAHLEGLCAFLRPFTSKTTSILHTSPCGTSIPVPSPRTAWFYRVLLSEAALLEHCCKEGVYCPCHPALFQPFWSY